MAAVEHSDYVACDLQDIARFLCRFDVRIEARFLDAVDETVRFPTVNRHAGRERTDLPLPELRSFRVESFRRYLIFYRPYAPGIRVVRVLHTSRDFKHLSWED